jgi:hypothetical protein
VDCGGAGVTWLRIGFEGALTHAVHASLSLHLIDDMFTREHLIKDFEQAYGRENAVSMGGNPIAITSWAFDLGGFWMSGEPTEDIELDGLKVSVACNHWPAVLSAVRRSELRRFSDGTPYHKLKFWHHATVLSVAQHRAAWMQLEAGNAYAAERLANWDDERKARTVRP